MRDINVFQRLASLSSSVDLSEEANAPIGRELWQ
jgi:hypothetical protein